MTNALKCRKGKTLTRVSTKAASLWYDEPPSASVRERLNERSVYSEGLLNERTLIAVAAGETEEGRRSLDVVVSIQLEIEVFASPLAPADAMLSASTPCALSAHRTSAVCPPPVETRSR